MGLDHRVFRLRLHGARPALPYNGAMGTRTLHARSYFEEGRLPLAVMEAQHGDRPVSLHDHEFIELVLFAEGSSLHEYAGKRYRLAPGDLFVIHPGEPHAYVQGRRARVFNCLFLPAALEPDLDYLRRIEGFFDLVMVEPFFRSERGLRDALHLDAATRLRVEELLKEMKVELARKAPGYEAAARAMLVQLLVLAARFRAQAAGAVHTEDDGRSGRRALVKDCIRYIEEHYPEQIRLDHLADRAYLSPEHFSRLFKRLTTRTPVAFIVALRVDKAKQLLATTTLSMTEIASRVGFSESNYFSRQFRKAAGMTPKQYRQRGSAGYL